MVALHRRGSSQCGVKGEFKGSGTAFDWAVLSRFIGVRFYQKRATAECGSRMVARYRRERSQCVEKEKLRGAE